MIKVIPLFSLLNDDSGTKNLRILPFLGAMYSDSMNFGNAPFPFFVAFTDSDL